MWSPLLLGLSLFASGCQQLNLPPPGGRDAEADAERAASSEAASAGARKPAAPRKPPVFPNSLDLKSADWAEVLRVAKVWAQDRAEVPEWSATFSPAQIYPGSAQPVVFAFRTDNALSHAVAAWGPPFASERNGKCHLWWFNPAAGLRANVQLEAPPTGSDCPTGGPTTLALRFSPYSSLEALLPLPDGRFPFEGETRLIGLGEGDIAKRFRLPPGESRRVSVTPFEDAWDDATLELRYKDGVVQRFQLHSAHSPEFADPTQADAAFAKAFGKPSRELEQGPIWRQYSHSGLLIEVGRGLNSLSVTGEACEHWDKKQLASGRDAALAEWIARKATANGDAKTNYRVRTHHGPEHAVQSLIERSIDSCKMELWSVSWEKPDCAPAGIVGEELSFSACCDKKCGLDPRQQLLQLLAATTVGDSARLSAILPPIGGAKVGHRYPGGNWSVSVSRDEVDSEESDALPTWSRISATSAQISCSLSPADATLNVCKIEGSPRFKFEFRGPYLDSVVSVAE
jgi:hypothetical protein